MRRLLTLPLLLSALTFASAAAGVAAQEADTSPNVVILLADDLGWGDVGFNGRKEWSTPHLDRLAKQGTQFKRWYTAGVTCAPSRAALMTGRYGIHNGVPGNGDDLPTEETTLAEALKARGYATGLFGKWHHGRARPGHATYVHPIDHGFDEFYGYTDARDAWEKFPTKLWDGRKEVPVKGYADTLFTDRALDFIRRQKGKRFFAYVPYIASHFNVAAPEEEVAKHRGKFPEKDPQQPLNATYAAMVTRLDHEVGRVLKTLEELNLDRNTLVIFSSDHGATFEVGNKGTSAFHDSNRPFRGQKRTLWEGGIRVPGIVRWPGHVPSGRVSEEVVHMTDVLSSTLAAVGSAPAPEWKVDGANLLPVWTGQAKGPERTLFWEWRAEGYHQLAAMRGELKLVVTGQNNPQELFNVVVDPAERRSLAPEMPTVARTLRRELDAWLATETEAAKWGKAPAPAAQPSQD